MPGQIHDFQISPVLLFCELTLLIRERKSVNHSLVFHVARIFFAQPTWMFHGKIKAYFFYLLQLSKGAPPGSKDPWKLVQDREMKEEGIKNGRLDFC